MSDRPREGGPAGTQGRGAGPGRGGLGRRPARRPGTVLLSHCACPVPKVRPDRPENRKLDVRPARPRPGPPRLRPLRSERGGRLRSGLVSAGTPCVCPPPLHPGGLEQVPGGRSLPEGRGTAELGTLQPRLCGLVTRLQGSNESGTGTRTRISAGDEPPGIGVENRWTPEMTCAEGKPKSLRRGGWAPCGPVPGLGLVRDPRVLAPLPGLRPRPHLHGSYQPQDTPGNAGRRPAPSESLSSALAARPTER